MPPDGEFQLMTYRITENVNLPFRVLPVVKELGRTRLEINVKVKSMFTFKLFATNVVIKIPLPKNTAVATVSAASGRVKYEPDQGGVIWKLRRFPGDQEYFMSGEVEMMSTMGDKAWSRPPIVMDFQVSTAQGEAQGEAQAHAQGHDRGEAQTHAQGQGPLICS